MIDQNGGTFVSFVVDSVHARKTAENKHSFVAEGVFNLASMGGVGRLT